MYWKQWTSYTIFLESLKQEAIHSGVGFGSGNETRWGVVLPSCVSGGKGKNQCLRQWWRSCPVYASQTQISNPNFQLSERQNHMNTVTTPRILGNRGGINPCCKLLSMHVYITYRVSILIITTLAPIE